MVIIIEMNINTSSLLSTPRLLAVVVATRARTSSKSQTGQNYYKNKIFVRVKFLWSNDIQSTKCFLNKLFLLGFLFLMNMIPGLATRYSLLKRIQIAAQDRFGDFFI